MGKINYFRLLCFAGGQLCLTVKIEKISSIVIENIAMSFNGGWVAHLFVQVFDLQVITFVFENGGVDVHKGIHIQMHGPLAVIGL